MNLLLLAGHELTASDRASVPATRYPARPGLWPPAEGRRLRVGVRGGHIGLATVEAIRDGRVEMHFVLDRAPPAVLPLTLLLALPRPKMLRRVLRSAAELGIKRIHLLNASRVEKSYWQSPLLAPPGLEACLVAGLEQACDTLLPTVALQPRLRPFVEDTLPALSSGSCRLLAHPGAASPAPAGATGHITLAIGPEGGFTDFEIALFATAGFRAVSLGPRILRVETALPALVSRLTEPGLQTQ